MKKIVFTSALLAAITLTSCGTGVDDRGTTTLSAVGNNTSTSTPNSRWIVEYENPTVAQATDLNLLQAGSPRVGDTLVTLHTNHGDIVIRMFPDEAPEAYENFVTHARDGFYNNVVFHRVIEGFMIQGGDPTGTGAGGGSIWGSGFYSEPSDYLRHFRGALAMAHAGPGTNGSQFYIVQNHTLDGGQLAQFEAYAENPNERYTADMAEGFIRYGGTPFLDLVQNARGHTVFGQVVLGMDVVDHIASLDSGDHNRNIPIEDVIIQNVSVEAYAG